MSEEHTRSEEHTSYGSRAVYSQVGDRFAVFEELRSRGPVIRQDGVVFTTGRAAAEEVFRHPDRFSSVFPNIGNLRPMIPIQIDPPEHRRYRKLLDPLFAPRAMAALERPIAELVNQRMDSFVDRGWCGFDEELAVPIPSEIFLTLMGLPMGDLDLLLELKDGILRPGFRQGVDVTDAETAKRIQDETGRRIYDYFGAVVDERRREPDRGDVMGRMLGARVEGVGLSDDEVLDACFLMLIAGLDTITNSLTLFYFQFTQRPDLRRAIVDDPGLIPAAVEELLRWETPTPAVPRVAAQDTEVCGFAVRKGEDISVDLGGADTDPAFQPDAGELRFDRASNPHYAFSGGIHRCLGSHLARQELRVTLREWHRRIPEYRVRPGTEPIWPPGLRSVENLVLEWER